MINAHQYPQGERVGQPKHSKRQGMSGSMVKISCFPRFEEAIPVHFDLQASIGMDIVLVDYMSSVSKQPLDGRATSYPHSVDTLDSEPRRW